MNLQASITVRRAPDDGKKGEDAVIVTANKYSHVYHVDAAGKAQPGTQFIKLEARKGGQLINIVADNISVSNVPANMSVSKFLNQIGLTVTNNFVPGDGYVDIAVSLFGGIHSLRFSWTSSRDGENAKIINIVASSDVIHVDKNGNYSPDIIDVIATVYNMQGNVSWKYSVNGNSYTTTRPNGVDLIVGSPNSVRITSSYTNFRILNIKAELEDISNTITITKMNDGEDGDKGENAKWIELNSSDTQIKHNGDGTVTPTNITVQAVLHNLTGTPTFYYKVDNNDFTAVEPAGINRVSNTVTVNTSQSIFNTLVVKVERNGYEKSLSISRTYDGSRQDVIYFRNTTGNTPGTPIGDNPINWTRTMPAPTSVLKYVFVSSRSGITGNWGAWSAPVLFNKWVNDGLPGKPGQIPVTKEWVRYDTHRNNDEYVDYIYVRGADKETSYWYKLISTGDVTAGVAPTGGTTPSGYERIDWYRDLAVKMLIAEGANIGGFIFKNNVFLGMDGNENATMYLSPDARNGDIAFAAGVSYAGEENEHRNYEVRHDGSVNIGNINGSRKLMIRNELLPADISTFIAEHKDINLGVNLSKSGEMYKSYGVYETPKIEWSIAVDKISSTFDVSFYSRTEHKGVKVFDMLDNDAEEFFAGNYSDSYLPEVFYHRQALIDDEDSSITVRPRYKVGNGSWANLSMQNDKLATLRVPPSSEINNTDLYIELYSTGWNRWAYEPNGFYRYRDSGFESVWYTKIVSGVPKPWIAYFGDYGVITRERNDNDYSPDYEYDTLFCMNNPEVHYHHAITQVTRYLKTQLTGVYADGLFSIQDEKNYIWAKQGSNGIMDIQVRGHIELLGENNNEGLRIADGGVEINRGNGWESLL